MSGLEVIAVIGAVAGVISAYKDASKIVQDFRDKRRAKKSEELEQSLAKAPLAVEEAKNYGIDRFGQAFEEGDRMKPILISVLHISSDRGCRNRTRGAQRCLDCIAKLSIEAAGSCCPRERCRRFLCSSRYIRYWPD